MTTLQAKISKVEETISDWNGRANVWCWARRLLKTLWSAKNKIMEWGQEIVVGQWRCKRKQLDDGKRCSADFRDSTNVKVIIQQRRR